MENNIPYNQELEESLIAKAMLDRDECLEIVSRVKVEDFVDDRNKKIYQAIIDLVNESKTPDIYLVKDKVGKDLKDYLTTVIQSGLDVGTKAKNLIDSIKKDYRNRQLAEICMKGYEDAYQGKTEAFTETLQSMLLFDTQKSKYQLDEKELTVWYQELLSQRYSGSGKVGLPFGFYRLDRGTAGARPGHLILIAGRPSQGKSAFLENLLTNFLNIGKAVYFVSAESSKEEVLDRVVGRLSGFGHNFLMTGINPKGEKWEKITGTLKDLAGKQFELNDDPDITTLEILAEATKLKHKKKLDVILVDYLQFLKDAVKESEERRVAKISNNLKTIARSLEVPVIVATQLNRQPETREDKAPKLADIRASGQAEQDSDLVIGLWRESEISPITNFRVLKQRSGSLGSFQLKFDGKLCRFDNLEKEHIEQDPLMEEIDKQLGEL